MSTPKSKFQMLSEQRAIRQPGQSIVKSRVAEVFAAFFKLSARALQFFNITIELFNVTLSLFGSEALSFSTSVFSLSTLTLGSFGLCGRRPDVFEVFFVSEIDDGDDWKRRQHGVKTDRVFRLHNTAGQKCSYKVSQR